MIDVTPGVCALCGKIGELRPYGPERKSICFACMKTDEEASRGRMNELFRDHDEIQIKEGQKLIALYRPPRENVRRGKR